MDGKQELLAALRAEYDRWQVLFDGLDETQLTSRTLPAGLSIKDVVGHLHAWQQISIVRLRGVIEDRPPIYPIWLDGLEPDAEENLEQINAAIHALHRDASWTSVHEAWQEGYQRVLELAAAIAESDLFDKQRYDWLDGYAPADVLQGTYEHHHDEHYTPLLASLRELGWVEA